MYKGLSREAIAKMVANDIPDGSYVNLGIGVPTLIANYISPDKEVFFQSEQGLLGMGPRPAPGQEDEDVVDAGKKPVTLVVGASIFSHSDSFLMIRGGHIDIACLGAFQVAANGDLANWVTDEENVTPGVGGAMDLAAGAKKVWVLMNHCGKNGEFRLLEQCTYPLTAAACVDRVYTNYAEIRVTSDGFLVERMVAGMTLADLQEISGARLALSPDWSVIESDGESNER
ncbi:MAG TPA: 3-oxoacid CoA-transferase subunit B [Eoetvoesiella sp.]